ncbi:MAG: beta-lactamase [Brevundimonas sp.]|nr:beta-lactamase [Brevundimonas sp.]
MLDRRGLFAAAAGSAALSFAPSAWARSPLPSADAVTALDALRKGKTTIGGVLVAVHKGQTVALYPWGKASLPFDVAVNERTLFHLGSNGKLMTSVAVFQLIEAGLVGPNDPIGAHVQGLPPSIAGIQINHLLHHTSGLIDYPEVLPDWDRPQTRDIVIAALKDQPVHFQPGESWQYSNTNYVLLGWLVADVSGQSYADYVQARLFNSAGTPTARADASQQIIPNRAEPYSIDSDGIRHSVRMDNEVSRSADGGVLFSALDVAPWRAALDTNRLLSAQSMSRIVSPGQLTSGRLAPYGCGVFLQRTRGADLWRHTGGVPGFVSNWLTWPQADLSILAVINSEGSGGVALGDMITTLAESIQPGVTWTGLAPAGDGSDVRTRALRSLLERSANSPAPDGLLASELSWMSGDGMARVQGLEKIVPLESWYVGANPAEGEMTRYRLTRGGVQRDIVVGWTADDRIYWGV